MKVKIFHGTELERVYECDSFDEVIEGGNNVLYVETEGVKTKVCNLGDFGTGCWSYEVEKEKGFTLQKLGNKTSILVHLDK